MSGLRFSSFAVALCATISTGAVAADMAALEAPPLAPQEKLEFGTGWYLRGDISWAREKLPVVFPDSTLGRSNKLQNSYSLTLGGGYKFNNWFRADLTFDYFKPVTSNLASAAFTCYDAIRIVNDINGNPVAVHADDNLCNAKQNAQVSRYALLVNGYLDLGNWSGVTPYVGAGVGAAYARVSGNYDWYYNSNGQHYGPTLVMPNNSPIPTVWLDNNGVAIPAPIANFGPQDYRRQINRRSFNMAWALMAGLAYDVSPNAKIDLGYRYINLGKLGAGLKSQTVSEYRIGVRYMID